MLRIWPPNCSKLAKNPKNDNDVTISRHDVIVKIFWCGFASLVKFSYWSKFHVNIITCSGIMTIFFYTGLTRNPDIGNTPIWVLPNIWKLGRVMDTKFGTNVSNRMLLNAAKFQGYSFHCFWVLLRENQLGVKLPPPPHPSRLIRGHSNIDKTNQNINQMGNERVITSKCLENAHITMIIL